MRNLYLIMYSDFSILVEMTFIYSIDFGEILGI